MRKVSILVLLLTLLFPLNVLASENLAVDKNEISIEIGKTAEITVTAKDAAGKLDIENADLNVVNLDKKTIFLDNSSEKIKITGKKVGEAKITITATNNFANYDEKILEGDNQVIIVKVIPKTTTQHHDGGGSSDGSSSIISIPDTGSVASYISLGIGALLIGTSGYLLYNKLSATKSKKKKNKKKR